ncbi:MAG: hypothetical protein NT129_06455 [Candidatus Aenigmarchaeota archaeon]|nr:hypothetical protein [Candidatus Aenigmarchaeota archaeon]
MDKPTVYSATKQLSQKGKEKLFNALEEYIDAKITIRVVPFQHYSNQEHEEHIKERAYHEMIKAKENLQNLLNYLKIEVE